MQPLEIKLEPKLDTDQQTFYIGKLGFPGTICLGSKNKRKGVAFLVYLDENISVLHITPSYSPELYEHFDHYDKVTKKQGRTKHNNLTIKLSPRYTNVDNDKESKKIFIGKINADITLSADEGLVFLLFVADKGEEELQISSPKHREKKKQVTTIDKRPIRTYTTR